MHGYERRSFMAEITIKYFDGKSRRAESIFGWGRQIVETGLGEIRTGIICLGSQSACSGRKFWEEKEPKAAEALIAIAESNSQQDPTFSSTIAYTRLTAKEAIKHLKDQGFKPKQIPSPSTMAEVLNRLGYRLRKVLKAKPQKKIKETDSIFENIKKKDKQTETNSVKRISMDIKATVKIGEYSRGGSTRGENKACDHDMGCKEKYTPCGIVDEDTGELFINFGSSYKTSDFIVDTLGDWWNNLSSEDSQKIELLQIKMDNGPENSGVRTQYLKRIIEFCDEIRKPIQLLYYPPYHSKYNPIERCWGILELHWNGTKLLDSESMLKWAQSMTWKGLNPVVRLSKKIYEKGISLCKKAMHKIEERLVRNPKLKKWDILIQPS
ncbi:Rhodopirellula transposase family protein [Candidatus Magnetomorum sp. HK-1]|nr:Rhodopirellula transposase family protein [Candidatus Magnetomorum sp. HK-1]